MIIDISAILRRLVLAGLPLAGAACSQATADTYLPLNQPGACFSGVIYETQEISSSQPSIRVGFHREDPRFGDLYAACTEEQLHCHRLCVEILGFANAPNHHGAGPWRCELGCDREGPTITIQYSTGVPGRRPQDLCLDVPTAPGTSLGQYWAAVALAEGASIAAFRTLAVELDAHGAPTDLVARARSSARDEARHFRLARDLARSLGHDVVRPRPQAPGIRPLAALARENAVEGCVGETFAAALALFQSHTAADLDVRAKLAEIAADELAHAQLAFDVHAWAMTRLSTEDRRFVAQERRRAAAGLVHSSARPVDPNLIRDAGLPAPATAARLAASTAAALWT